MRPLLKSFGQFWRSPQFRKETYDAVGAVWASTHFRNPEKSAPRYVRWKVSTANGMILTSRRGPATEQYWEPWLMDHFREHVPGFTFQTEYVSIIDMIMNPIYGDLEPGELREVEVERPLLQRDRLLQVFAAPPRGSYADYAAQGLAAFQAAVGSFAAARIDQFFAMIIPIIKQPYGPAVNDASSDLETRYWESRKNFVEYFAGLGRPWPEGWGKSLRMKVLERARSRDNWQVSASTLPVEEQLSAKQMQELVVKLLPAIDQLDATTERAFKDRVTALYKKAVAENRVGTGT